MGSQKFNGDLVITGALGDGTNSISVTNIVSGQLNSETVDLDTFIACEDTSFIQHFGEELPISADDFIFTYFFIGNKCVLPNAKYETMSGLDITETQYNSFKKCMSLNLSSATLPVMEGETGPGIITVRKQVTSTKTEENNVFEITYFNGGIHHLSMIKISGTDSETGESHAFYELYYFKATSDSAAGRSYISFTAAEQISGSDLASLEAGVDWGTVFQGRSIQFTRGWKKTMTLAEIAQYYPFDLSDDTKWRDNFMWISVPGRPTYDFLIPGPMILIIPSFVSDCFIALIGQENNNVITLNVLEYEVANRIAPLFSTTSTYAVGDLVTYKTKLYKCITAITSAGNWSESKWTAVDAKDVFASKSECGTKLYRHSIALTYQDSHHSWSEVLNVVTNFSDILTANTYTDSRYGLVIPTPTENKYFMDPTVRRGTSGQYAFAPIVYYSYSDAINVIYLDSEDISNKITLLDYQNKPVSITDTVIAL